MFLYNTKFVKFPKADSIYFSTNVILVTLVVFGHVVSSWGFVLLFVVKKFVAHMFSICKRSSANNFPHLHRPTPIAIDVCFCLSFVCCLKHFSRCAIIETKLLFFHVLFISIIVFLYSKSKFYVCIFYVIVVF